MHDVRSCQDCWLSNAPISDSSEAWAQPEMLSLALQGPVTATGPLMGPISPTNNPATVDGEYDLTQAIAGPIENSSYTSRGFSNAPAQGPFNGPATPVSVGLEAPTPAASVAGSAPTPAATSTRTTPVVIPAAVSTPPTATPKAAPAPAMATAAAPTLMTTPAAVAAAPSAKAAAPATAATGATAAPAVTGRKMNL